nr:transposase [Tenacibaculum finnmarkense]
MQYLYKNKLSDFKSWHQKEHAEIIQRSYGRYGCCHEFNRQKVEDENLKSFNTIKKTIQHHYKPILNYFNNRNTNASAESFNTKIKAFRAQFRGVRDVTFFLYRLTKIYA